MDMTTLKDFFAGMDVAALRQAADDLVARAISFTAPIPDSAMIGIFLALLVGLHWSHVRASRRARAALQAVYTNELVKANRLTHQARAEVTHARLEIERERQKKRRVERRAPDRNASRPIALVTQVAERRPNFA